MNRHFRRQQSRIGLDLNAKFKKRFSFVRVILIGQVCRSLKKIDDEVDNFEAFQHHDKQRTDSANHTGHPYVAFRGYCHETRANFLNFVPMSSRDFPQGVRQEISGR
jgi:hypothetical protein